MHIKYDEEFKKKIKDEYENSVISANGLCEKYEIARATLMSWKKRDKWSKSEKFKYAEYVKEQKRPDIWHEKRKGNDFSKKSGIYAELITDRQMKIMDVVSQFTKAEKIEFGIDRMVALLIDASSKDLNELNTYETEKIMTANAKITESLASLMERWERLKTEEKLGVFKEKKMALDNQKLEIEIRKLQEELGESSNEKEENMSTTIVDLIKSELQKNSEYVQDDNMFYDVEKDGK